MNEKFMEWDRRIGLWALCASPVCVALLLVVFLMGFDAAAMFFCYAMIACLSVYTATVAVELADEIVKQVRESRGGVKAKFA